MNARRQLLGTALRLAPAMAPDVHAIMESCRATLQITAPVETYVYPAPVFNAAAVRPERGLLLVMLSSSLLEAFDAPELKFVVGHELGHHLFEHHRIPTGALLGGQNPISAELALQLFAWQRYAEISCDRAGMACAGGFKPAAHSLFKLASGLRGGRVNILIDQFVAQAGDLREESLREAKADAPARADWFTTHPFSPLRLRAAELYSKSAQMAPGGTGMDQLEDEVQALMSLMDPSYLQERSEAAEAMRRLLFAGAVSLAVVRGEPNKAVLAALENLLGAGSVPRPLNTRAIIDELPKRIEGVNQAVPSLRRAQVVHDLCVIARADGIADELEIQQIEKIAQAIGVHPTIISCGVCGETRLD
ncbi:MAG: hypothetical protein FJY56_12795 [Betaproteobacteria bacterium]|nr:hypothetical protein [Betaproteobacteria bacterium]